MAQAARLRRPVLATKGQLPPWVESESMAFVPITAFSPSVVVDDPQEFLTLFKRDLPTGKQFGKPHNSRQGGAQLVADRRDKLAFDTFSVFLRGHVADDEQALLGGDLHGPPFVITQAPICTDLVLKKGQAALGKGCVQSLHGPVGRFGRQYL